MREIRACLYCEGKPSKERKQVAGRGGGNQTKGWDKVMATWGDIKRRRADKKNLGI